ncbi:hypothetical protein ACHAXS_000851 [Conticribra weissflogii]
MLKLQMESSHLPKGSLISNMCMESLPLAILITAVWLECIGTILDTHLDITYAVNVGMKQWMILSVSKAELDT